jgi:hypothetical protein
MEHRTWLRRWREKADRRTTSQLKGFMVATMNPFMTERRGLIMKKSARTEFGPQFFVCEQSNRINSRRTTRKTRDNSIRASRSHPRLPGGRDI